MAHPARFELTTSAFGGQRSIQLSYGCLPLDRGFRPIPGARIEVAGTIQEAPDRVKLSGMTRRPDEHRNRDRSEVRPNFKKQATSGPDGTGVPDPETLALLALGHVVGDETLLPRFLALSGVATDELRERAQDPVLLGAVLDFLLAHEPDLVAFAEAQNLPPTAIAIARRKLPGGEVED